MVERGEVEGEKVYSLTYMDDMVLLEEEEIKAIRARFEKFIRKKELWL